MDNGEWDLKTLPTLVKGDELLLDDSLEDVYEASRDISKYLLMHYGSLEDVFGERDHPLAMAHGYPQRLSRVLQLAASRTETRVLRALDVGCSVGGVSHALSGWVEEQVLGLDVSARSIDVASSLTLHGGGTFGVIQQGPFSQEVTFRVRDESERCEVGFQVGDACDLDGLGSFDVVVLSNVLDRVPDPGGCLDQFLTEGGPLSSGGLLVVACPWSWYPEFSKPEKWFGSPDGSMSSEDHLKERLKAGFSLVHEGDEPAVLRQNPREYDYFNAHVTVWKKF
jgi:SAM-dependent methyltransferase